MLPRAGIVAFLLLAFTACPKPPRPADPALTLSVPYAIDGLDPHVHDRLGDSAVAAHFYEPLVAADADMVLHPALAVRWESPDSLTWIFHLRSAVTFHSGKPFDADDVVYTFDRLRTDRDLDMGVYAVQVANVAAMDALTVRIRTLRPTAVLLNKLSSIVIVPRGSTIDSLRGAVDGTGPYRLLEFRRGSAARLARNESYWGRKPAFRDVTILFDRAPADALADLEAGRAQFAQVSKHAEEALRNRTGIRLVRRTGVFLKYLGFDLGNEVTPFVSRRPNPFRNRAVREAVSLAIDRRRLVSSLPSFAVPASQIVPPFVFGFQPSLPELAYDPERARTILREAGLGGGLDVTLHSRRVVDEATPALREMLAAVGIRATVVDLDETAYFRMATERTFSFFLTRFGCASGDASDVLDSAFHSIDVPRHLGTGNIGSFSDPSLDRAIEASEETLEMSSRREKLQAMMTRIARDVLWVPLYFDQDVYALRDDLVFHPRADSFVLAWEIGSGPP